MSCVLGTYLVAQLPGWGLAGGVLWALQHWDMLSPGFAAGLLLALIGKDVLLYPVMRHFYESQPAARRMIGERGTVVTALAPEGLVRLRGELWKARSVQDEVPAGASVRVRDVDGLTLFVVTEPNGLEP
jgi:membrane protein implicated in regulation of membrane protease activity